MKKTFSQTFNQVIHVLWSLFLNGLFTLLPIALTITVFGFSFRIIKNWLRPLASYKPAIFDVIPHSEVLLAFIFILLVGVIAKLFIISPIIHAIERVIFKIPIVRPVYSGVRQLVSAFNPHNKVSFKQIVMIQFPRQGIYSLGFLTNDVSPEMAPGKQNGYCSIFIPTTPNPTTGYYLIMKMDEITPVDLTQQEAMALIISGGIIQPERFAK